MIINKEATPKFIQIKNKCTNGKSHDPSKNEIIASEIYNKLDKGRSADTHMNYGMIHDAILNGKDKHMPCKLVKLNNTNIRSQNG